MSILLFRSIYYFLGNANLTQQLEPQKLSQLFTWNCNPKVNTKLFYPKTVTT